jgi:hypothetical protein
MANEAIEKKRPYRWLAFTHWANLTLLATTGIAGAVVDPIIWLLAAPLEMGALWVVPDLPMFRAGVDQRQVGEDLMKERAYYLEQLWGLLPSKKSLGRRFVEWFADLGEDDLDDRVIQRNGSFQHYEAMRGLIAKLVEVEKVRGMRIVSNEMSRLQQVVNGYLRYLVACGSLEEALRVVDAKSIRNEVASIDQRLGDADPSLRAVLLERRRLCEAHLERLPRLRATLELLRTRAEAIVYQMQNLHGQVLADPGVDVNAFLDEVVQKHELLADPLGDLEADQEIREFLQSSAVPRSTGSVTPGRRSRAAQRTSG